MCVPRPSSLLQDTLAIGWGWGGGGGGGARLLLNLDTVQAIATIMYMHAGSLLRTKYVISSCLICAEALLRLPLSLINVPYSLNQTHVVAV